FFFFQAEDGIRDRTVTGVQTCALPIFPWSQITNFVKTNISFTNQRENKTIKGTEIDIARLITWNATNRWLRTVIPGGDIATVYEIGRASCRERVWKSGGDG